MVPKDLYYGVLDPVGTDKREKEITTKNSLNALQIWMYPNDTYGGDYLCSTYVGRYGNSDTASELFKLELARYNAKGLPEVDRGTTVADFRRWASLHMIYRDPASLINETQKDNSNASYGINIGSSHRAEDGLLYLKDFLYTPCGVSEDGEPKFILHYVKDLPFLKELLQFSNNGNFDRISAARVAMFQRLAYRTKRRKPQNSSAGKTMLGNIGLYRK
jgi:hypothetical protein